VFWSVCILALFLLVASTRLNYPLGYGTNLFVYLLFLAICVFWMPEDYQVLFIRRYKFFARLGIGFFAAFVLTGGAIMIPLTETFDFDDTTVFLNKKYRVVITEEVITSGGRRYFAILRRKWLSEYCIFNPGYYRRVDEPMILEINDQPALILRSERKGFERDTIWFNDAE